MIVIGHRGASGYQPENTLAAFRAAAALGCSWVELDVRAVHGRLLVIHDEQLGRTTNGTGALTDHTLDALRALDAGIKIGITYVENVPISVDTVEDLMVIENILNSTDENK